MTALAAILASACVAAGCVRWWIVAAGALKAMLWKHPGLQIGWSQGQGSKPRWDRDAVSCVR